MAASPQSPYTHVRLGAAISASCTAAVDSLTRLLEGASTASVDSVGAGQPSADASSSSSASAAAAVQHSPNALNTLEAARQVIASGQPDPDALHAAILSLMQSLAIGKRTAAQLEAANLVKEYVDRPVECWRTQAWAAIGPDSFADEQLSASFATLNKHVTTAIGDFKLTELRNNHPQLSQSLIAGNVVQTAFASSHERALPHTSAITELFHRIVRAAVRLVAPDFLQGRATHFTVTKLLVVEAGEGEQPIHWDSDRWHDDKDDRSVISALYYPCSCDSALLPASFSAVDCFPQEMDQLTMMARAKLLDKKFFRSIELDDGGTLLLFRHCVPHAGAVCRTAHPRAAVFGMLTCRLDGLAQEDQCFEWCYIASAFGNRSEEYYTSLCKNKQHEPLKRLHSKERAATNEWMKKEKKRQNQK